ncbi:MULTISPECIES: MFS transporter [Aeromicrobium]|uniref:MFS transporter n=1 Tax=Aeromicrobium yanjiei TaxID=2662028 RepID=A0A5Q2MMF7_9ACTN|nr:MULTISPECIES: MFS transporter [Aeromicrobium]MRK00818.1 MFS transporter [Aeromicrobium sp. S22]QGG42366.1 MFS transporter [Aeromicrobium yanjiei]
MYISVNDRPAGGRGSAAGKGSGKRVRVAPVVVSLGLVSLLTDISSESVAAILPLYLTTVLGLSPVAYGFLDGLYQGASALVRIASGWAADRGGHPKWVAFLGYGLSAVAKVGLLVASGFAAITAVVAVDRVGKGIRTAPRDAMIAASSPVSHLGRAFAVHRTLDTIGAVLGPFIAFAILWAVPDGYTTVMIVSLAFALVGLALLGLLVPDQRLTRPASPARTAPAFRWRQVCDPQLTKLLVAAGALGLLTVGDGFVYLALLDRGGFAATWFALLYVGTNLAYLALAVPLGRIADRVGRTRVLVGGHVALILTYVCAALPLGGLAVVILPLLLLGTFYAATDGVLAAVAGRLAAPEVRASGIACAQTVVALARLVASTGFGLLWFTMGPHRALLTVAGLLLVVVVVAYVWVRDLDAPPRA